MEIWGNRKISRNLSYLKMDSYWTTNFAKFVISACPLSVIGYQMFNSLLLFKYEIKQNVSNTNIVKNKILISFAMVSMAGAMIRFLQISRNLQKSTKSQISRNLSFWPIHSVLLVAKYSSHCYYSNTKLNKM